MSTFNVPNEFVPQTAQPISSAQVDENFDALETQINNINSALGASTGTVTEVRKIVYTQRPAYSGTAAPAANELIEKRWIEATRGCRVGDIILSINPAVLPTDYNVVWAKMEGQQLAQATYPDFYAICQSIGGAEAGRYNPATGATAGNFVAPDWRGGVPVQILAGGTGLISSVPNFAAANWLGSMLGEAAHKQTTAEVGSHTHGVSYFNGTETGNDQRVLNGGSTQQTAVNQADAAVQAMNIVQRCFVSLVWVRIR